MSDSSRENDQKLALNGLKLTKAEKTFILNTLNLSDSQFEKEYRKWRTENACLEEPPKNHSGAVPTHTDAT